MCETNATNSKRFFKRAAVQFEFAKAYLRDVSYQENGSIIYAVDSDIFCMYGGATKKLFGNDVVQYGQVFDSDPDAAAVTISAKLADYIFFKLVPKHPVMVIPPVNNEVGRIINALLTRIAEADRQPLSVESQSYETEEEKEKALRKYVDDIFFGTKSVWNEFQRLCSLIKNTRLAPPSVVMQSMLMDNVVRIDELQKIASILDENNAEHIFRINRLRRDWERHLVAVQGPDYGPPKIHDKVDAEALARLECWNSELQRLNIACKVVYITGSARVFAAAERHAHAHAYEFPNFAKSYLRHPRSFLDAPDVIVSDMKNQKVEGFYGMLSTFQNRIHKKSGEQTNESIRSGVAREAQVQIAGEVDKFLKEWGDYRDSLRASYNPPEGEIDRLRIMCNRLKRRKNAVDEWMGLYDELKKKLLPRAMKEWEECFDAATKAGWVHTWVLGTGRGKRHYNPFSAALIRFSRWTDRTKFINKLTNWHHAGDINIAEYEQGIKRILEEDSTKYSFYLAHSAFFAGQGEWTSAQTLSSCAIKIAEKEQRDKGGEAEIDGREAYFLKAVCLRRNADGPRDIDKASAALMQAETIYKNYDLDKMRGSFGQFDIVPERFRVERLVQQVSYLLFDQYISKTSANYPDLWRGLGREAGSLLDAISLALQDGSRTADELVHGFLRKAGCRTAANIILCLIMSEPEPQILKTHPGFLDALAFFDGYEQEVRHRNEQERLATDDRLNKEKDIDALAVISLFDQRMVQFARAIRGDASSADTPGQLQEYFTGRNKDRISSFAYDDKLCGDLAEKAEKFERRHSL